MSPKGIRPAGNTAITGFRLGAEYLALFDSIVERASLRTGVRMNRTAVLRNMLRREAKRLGITPRNIKGVMK